MYNSAEDQPEDVMIAHIARTCFPELAARRLKEIEGDRDSFNAELPIFYCKSVVFVFNALRRAARRRQEEHAAVHRNAGGLMHTVYALVMFVFWLLCGA